MDRSLRGGHIAHHYLLPREVNGGISDSQRRDAQKLPVCVPRLQLQRLEGGREAGQFDVQDILVLCHAIAGRHVEDAVLDVEGDQVLVIRGVTLQDDAGNRCLAVDPQRVQTERGIEIDSGAPIQEH